MSTLTNNSRGSKVLQFVAPNGGRRKTLTLGRMPERDARDIQRHVDELVEAAALGRALTPSTLDWLRRVGTKLHGKLSDVGLVSARVDATDLTLAGFTRAMIDSRTHWKKPTRLKHEQARDKLIAFLRGTIDIRSVTEADAKAFRRDQDAKHAEPTVATRIMCCRRFFGDAVDKRIIDRNPFLAVRAGSFESEHAEHVDAKRVEALIEKADVETGAILALARYQGLRIPSELLDLRWSDVDFVASRLTIRAPKTGTRVMPLFGRTAELLAALKADRDADDNDSPYVIRRKLTEGTNLRTGVIRLAGGKASAWPRLFHNLRASCQTDLIDDGHHLHVVCKWLGNSPKIARKHYLRVTDEHFRKAAGSFVARCESAAPAMPAETRTHPPRPSPLRENEDAPLSQGVVVVGAGAVRVSGKRAGNQRLSAKRAALLKQRTVAAVEKALRRANQSRYALDLALASRHLRKRGGL